MNTQDPYRDLSAMKSRKEYSGYDDFVPYRSDWRYSVGLFSLLMIAGIAYSYWTLRPEAAKPMVKTTVAKVVSTTVTSPGNAPVLKQAQPIQPAQEVVTPAVTAKPKSVKQKKQTEDTTEPVSSKKPEPFKPVTGPASY
jgi:hypothetical protein